MAVITPDELRLALGADVTLQARVDSIHAAVCARVTRYAGGAPDAVKTEAIIVYGGWLYQSAAQRRSSVFPTDGEGPPINVSRAFLLSGAQGLLSSWHVPRAGASVLP